MKPRIVVIIQARLSSRRLPRKVLAELNGHALLWHVLRRALLIPGVAGVLLAMPRHTPADEVSAVVDDAVRAVQCVFPPVPEDDVLARYQWAAALAKADVIVRVTADCPWLDPQLSGRVLERFLESGVEYCCNCGVHTTWADGLDTEVFSRDALERACELVTDALDREHVGRWISQHCLRTTLPAPLNMGACKWSIDREQDLRLARCMASYLRPADATDWQATMGAWTMANQNGVT